MRLVQRRQGNVALQPCHDGLIDQHRLGVIRPAMDDPVSDGEWCDPHLLAQPRGSGL